MPKVTVAMPIYNDETFLREAIDSILVQTFTDFELLIINDGSTDGSMDIVRSYTDSRIRILDFAENKGRPFVRNAALDNACGEYLAWMDSDDISKPERLEKQVTFMEAHPEIAICGTALEVFHEEHYVHCPPLGHEEIQARIMYECALPNPTICMRVQALREHNVRYRLGMLRAEDYAFWIDVFFTTSLRCANMPDVLLNYRYFYRPTSRAYHVKAVRYLLEYLNVPSTEENAAKHATLSFADSTDLPYFSEKDILTWANTLYEALPKQKNISQAHALRELHIKVERFLGNMKNSLRFLHYYRSLPLGASHNLLRLLGLLFLRKVHKRVKRFL